MRTIAPILMLVSASEAFAPHPPPSRKTATPSSTALGIIDTRKRVQDQEIGIWQTAVRNNISDDYVPRDAYVGLDRRDARVSYAPPHGTPTSYGAIGCPGGGDWCYAGGFKAAAPINRDFDARKKAAATVAGALAGLGKGVGGATTDGVGISVKGGIVRGAPPIASLPSAMGEDAREARGGYSPYSHEGRVGALGEIGAAAGGNSSGPHPSGLALPSGRQVGSTGDYFQSLGSLSEAPPPKRYGLGSWKK